MSRNATLAMDRRRQGVGVCRLGSSQCRGAASCGGDSMRKITISSLLVLLAGCAGGLGGGGVLEGCPKEL